MAASAQSRPSTPASGLNPSLCPLTLSFLLPEQLPSELVCGPQRSGEGGVGGGVWKRGCGEEGDAPPGRATSLALLLRPDWPCFPGVKLEASAEYLTWKQKVSVVKNKFGKLLICATGSMSFSLTLTTQNSATRTTSLFLSAFFLSPKSLTHRALRTSGTRRPSLLCLSNSLGLKAHHPSLVQSPPL